jgi:hypothetical protein
VIVRARAAAWTLASLVLAPGLSTGCAANARPTVASAPSPDAREDLRRAVGRPPLVILARDGDPRSAVALAMTTEGIAPPHGAEVPVALAALLESRLGSRGSVVPSGYGVQARGLASNAAEGAALVNELRSALLTPVSSAELAPVRKKLAALAQRPLLDPALDLAARCTGETRALTGAHREPEGPNVETLETWRQAAAGLGRVAMATAGSAAVGDAVADALLRGAPWPSATAIASEPRATDEARVYDATSDMTAGGARVTLAARAMRAEDAVRAAAWLGDPGGALAARLGGLDAPAKLRDVTATAHARGGCVVVTFEIEPRDLAVDAPARIATAVALARQEMATDLMATPTESHDEAPSAYGLARREGDPRDAADVAAWWALSSPDPEADGEPRVTTAVGLSTSREAGPNDPAAASAASGIRAEIDRAIVAWHEPVVEARTRVEQGQGELWLALGSPCGTLSEMANDAGLGAAFAMAAADRADLALRSSGAHAEPWAAPDGIGVIVHGAALAGESPEAQARRLGDAAGRSFAAEPVDRGAISRARARLLGEGERSDARALVTLAKAVAPGHPSWLAPMGPIDALGRSSDAAVAARASALRAGPLRVAVIGNTSASQTEAAVRAVDRWIARRPGEARACPIPSVPAPARPATYTVDAPSEGGAWLAVALPAATPASGAAASDGAPGASAPATSGSARVAGEWIAATLDGPDGLLSHALGGGLARGWSARVIGSSRAAALVVRVESVAGGLDGAVAQVRALLDRIRQGSLTESDRARATALLAERDLASSLDPAHRVASLWQDPHDAPPPTLEALRSFAAATLRDDALVIVAVRPPRTTTPKPPS